MNQNQLLKAIKRAGQAYSNTANYAKILQNTPCIKLSLGNIINHNYIIDNWNSIMDRATSLPWASVLFDIRDYFIPDYITGELSTNNIGIHMQAISVELNAVQIPMMVFQDWRSVGKAVIGKTYVMYGDQAGIHTMCSVDQLATGCKCHKSNVFSVNPEYALKIQDCTPCFTGDVGFSLPDCSGTMSPDCSSTIVQKSDITNLAKLILTFMNLPSNCILRVTVNDKILQTYYIIIDENQLSRLINGDESAELNDNLFIDGSKLLMELDKPIFSPTIAPFWIKNKKYEVVVDKVRASTKHSPEGNEQNQSSMGPGVFENPQSGSTS